MPSTYTNLLYHIVFSTKERRPVSKSQADIVRAYIQGQERHHRRRTFKQELVSLLKKNDIEYDERYLWD